MTRSFLWACALALCFSLSCVADLTYPASFDVIEEQPGQFRLSLTVPMVKGRYLKLKPIVPEAFHVKGEPEVTVGDASLTKTWQAFSDPDALYSNPFGLEGLLGTVHEVRFLLTTLDGRRYERVLRPTHSIFLVPRPEPATKLMVEYGRHGFRTSVRTLGLWAIFAALLFSGLSQRRILISLLLIMIGVLLFQARMIPALAPELSDQEGERVILFLLGGYTMGTLGILIVFTLLRSLIKKAVLPRFFMCAWVIASAWMIYQGAGLLYYNGPLWVDSFQRFAGAMGHRYFSPFVSDWAMAKLRIPIVSILAAMAFILAAVKIKYKPVQLPVCFGLFVLLITLLPYGTVKATIPFRNPTAPAAKQAHRIIEPMLSSIYKALNLEDEEETYDELSGRVSQHLITDLYLDSRRRLVSGVREGASVTVKQVDVESVEPLSSGPDLHTYQCKWVVTAKVTHWQHTHERINRYEGDLGLIVEEDAWKLAALNLQSEEREIVKGSFTSR